MVGVAQAHAHHLADTAHASAQPRRALDERQCRRIERGQPGERSRRKDLARNIVDLRGQVAQPSLGIDQRGAFLSRRTVAQQLHLVS